MKTYRGFRLLTNAAEYLIENYSIMEVKLAMINLIQILVKLEMSGYSDKHFFKLLGEDNAYTLKYLIEELYEGDRSHSHSEIIEIATDINVILTTFDGF